MSMSVPKYSHCGLYLQHHIVARKRKRNGPKGVENAKNAVGRAPWRQRILHVGNGTLVDRCCEGNGGVPVEPTWDMSLSLI